MEDAPLGGRESVGTNVFFTPRSVDVAGASISTSCYWGVNILQDKMVQLLIPIWTTGNAKSIQDTHRVFGGCNFILCN